MLSRRILAALGIVIGWAPASFAQTAADSASEDSDDMLAPRGAFELGVHGGYTQPFGHLSGQQEVGDLVNAGGGITLDLGYRLSPYWSVAAFGHFHNNESDDTFVSDMDVRGTAGGIMVTVHATPFQSALPWLAFGGGYRALWIVPEGPRPNHLYHGFELAKLNAGIDFRITDSVAFGPIIGADLNMLLWQDIDGEGTSLIDDPRPIAFLYAGAAAHFDIGGTRETRRGEITRDVADARSTAR